MKTLDDWWSEAASELGVTPTVGPSLVLDLARDAAHGVMRPAAPLAAYLVGLAVGAGADAEEAVRKLSDLAAGWPSE